VSIENREELSEEFYETLQKILDTVNNNDYMLLIGVTDASVRSNEAATNIVSTNGEAALNNNSKKLIDICIFCNSKVMKTHFLSINKSINLLGRLESRN
jgi:hypothetical protein